MNYRGLFNEIINFEEGGIKAFYFKGRNTAIMAHSAEEARAKKKRGGDELVAVRTPSESDRKAMAAGRWVRTRRDGKSPEKSRYGKGRGYGPPRERNFSEELRDIVTFSKLDWAAQLWSDKARERVNEQTKQLKESNKIRRKTAFMRHSSSPSNVPQLEKMPYAMRMSARDEFNSIISFSRYIPENLPAWAKRAKNEAYKKPIIKAGEKRATPEEAKDGFAMIRETIRKGELRKL